MFLSKYPDFGGNIDMSLDIVSMFIRPEQINSVYSLTGYIWQG